MADFVPPKQGDQRKWFLNLETEITGVATILTITPARLALITGWCSDATDAMDADETAQRAATFACKAKNTQIATSLTGIRNEVTKWKTEPGMTEDIAALLQIIGTSTPFNSETYQPQVTATVFSGYVRFKFKKLGASGINLYYRIKGTMGWKFVARYTNSPYDDHTPLAVPGVSEVREYQAFGILVDDQIGLPCDIITVTFAG